MNCIIFIKGSNKVSYFVEDCIKHDNNFIGTNIKLNGIKPTLWDYKWTKDSLSPIYNEENEIVGWDKDVDSIKEIDIEENNYEINKMSHKEYKEALKIKNEFQKLNKRIDINLDDELNDIKSIKEYLLVLSKTILAISKILDREMK